MIKPNKYVDWIFLTLLGITLCLTFYRHYTNGYIISVNNVFAVFCFSGGVSTKLISRERGSYVVLILLLLATLNVINFTIGVSSVHFGILGKDGDSISYQYPGIDPFFLLGLLIYWIINRKAVRQIWETLYYGSEKEQVIEVKSKVDFYYQKFKDCKEEELKQIFNMYNDYPSEAQCALRKIHEERNLSLVNF